MNSIRLVPLTHSSDHVLMDFLLLELQKNMHNRRHNILDNAICLNDSLAWEKKVSPCLNSMYHLKFRCILFFAVTFIWVIEFVLVDVLANRTNRAGIPAEEKLLLSWIVLAIYLHIHTLSDYLSLILRSQNLDCSNFFASSTSTSLQQLHPVPPKNQAIIISILWWFLCCLPLV